jgi:hypothetical protein
VVDDFIVCGGDAGTSPHLSRHRHLSSVTTSSGASDDAETTERAQLSKATPVRRLFEEGKHNYAGLASSSEEKLEPLR